MDRRHLLLAASAGLILPSLSEQTSFSLAARAAEGEPKFGVETYETSTLLIGAFSKRLSEMAVQKANNADLKAFASYEIAEQTALAEVLTDKTDPKPASMTPQQMDMLEKLGKQSGTAFDKAYLNDQITGHEQLKVLQEAYLKAHGMTTDHGHIARLAKMVIDMHLSMLHTLKNSIG